MRKEDCSKCGQKVEESRAGQRYCKECHNKHARENRKKYKEYTTEQKLKADCRTKTKLAIKRGKLIKQPCQICGEIEVEAHHQDYNKPLEVVWLCREHHLELHNNLE